MDVLEIFVGSIPVKLREFYIVSDNGTQNTEQSFAAIISRLAPPITPGSGGQAVTPVPLRSTDSAASFTARAFDTTPTTGTSYGDIASGVNIFNGWHYCPTEDLCMVFQPGEALVISTGGLTSGTNFSAYVTIEELA